MAHDGAVTPETLDRTTGGRATTASTGRCPRFPSLKIALFIAVLFGLGAVVAVALIREARTAVPAASARATVVPPRPALTPAEDAYARALWSIHGDVKRSAFQLTMAGLNYKTGQIDRTALRTRVQAAGEVYRRAEIQVRDLAPPVALQGAHAEYMEAVRLYGQSAREMARVSEDGKDGHLGAAFPMTQEAGRKLLQVGKILWPGEYVPN